MQPIRIQKALSEAGVASRRRAEELVREGRVTVNGRRAEIGQSVNPDRDVVAVDGRRVYFARKKQYRYLMMNKPRGYVTTLSDELGRRCVTDLLAGTLAYADGATCDHHHGEEGHTCGEHGCGSHTCEH